MTDLDKLIEAVEGGVWDHSPNGCVRAVFPYKSASIDDLGLTAAEAFSGSLDAAKALHEALLPGWFPGVSQNIHSGYWYAWVQDKVTSHYSATGNNPARAWLLSILKAYRSMQ